ncbi:E3 ubiquitin/ISG15 ligase TRIM25-like [Myxocyprinus asiaticus]|uniref:E3 ubiquitin/ISG15 ligase TRIM25-like n=1 Tax=Myxocyprinus asiaticus TaxID=70543 RepID=UPI00222216EB|nr:E3 ubiquitin/ISG15 ligase TRIM25-like [Myxocyprinus asiaticus]
MCKYESFSCSKMTDQESLSCSICLDLFKNPVIIPCGDTFCKDCITGLWEQCDHLGLFSCPQCKQTFSQRPHLIKCVVVKELCEKLRKMRPQTLSGVSCDSCTTTRMKAIKSCLTCLLSFCDSHVEQHNDLHGGKKHQLIDATDLQSKTCSQHGKLLEFYCRTDQQCICVLCGMNDHKNHDTISAADEREEKQSTLMKTHEKFLQKIQDRENDFKELTKAEESVKHSAQTTVAECERIFSEVVSSIQKISARIKEVISDKERAELSRIQELQEKVQQEIVDMKMKVSELDQLMPTEDHIQFLQNSSSHYDEPTSEKIQDLSSMSLNANVLFHDVMMMVSKVQERWMDVNKETEAEISGKDFVDEAVDAPETVKPSAAPTFSFQSHSTKKEGQWDCEKMKSISQGLCTRIHREAVNSSIGFMDLTRASAPSLQERCAKVLPLLVEQLQLSALMKLQVQLSLLRCIYCIYCCILQMERSTQHTPLTSTLGRLGEEVSHGSADPGNSIHSRGCPLFMSSYLHTYFLSSIIKTISQGEAQMNI